MAGRESHFKPDFLCGHAWLILRLIFHWQTFSPPSSLIQFDLLSASVCKDGNSNGISCHLLITSIRLHWGELVNTPGGF